MSRFAWSPVIVERLLILRAQGLRLSKIAAELGTTSSAIEHKLRRLRSQKPSRPRLFAVLSRYLIFARITAAGLYWGAAKGRCFAASRRWARRPTALSTPSKRGRGWK